jgi:hypothetical protein
MGQSNFVTLILCGEGKRRKTSELFVSSFPNPFGDYIENTSLTLNKISTVYTHGVLKTTQNLNSVFSYHQLTLTMVDTPLS